jgi:hypothetical protein
MATWEIGNIDNSIIGATTPQPGAFTTLKSATDPTDEHGVGDRGYNDARYIQGASGGVLSSTAVSFSVNASTLLYTVPTGQRAIVVDVLVVCGSVNPGNTKLSYGKGTAYTDWTGVATVDLSGMNDAYWVGGTTLKMDGAGTVQDKPTYAAGDTFGVTVTNHGGGSNNRIVVVGYLITAF